MPDPDMTPAAHAACEEALKRIGDCLRRRGTVLDLSGLGLTQVPAKITQLPKLTDLNLARNQLDRLPPDLDQLTQLTKLDLSHNALASLPPVLGQFPQLALLDLSHNALVTLPAAIRNLAGLTRLDLSHNPLVDLPPEIGQLTQLTRLYLTHTRLANLTTGIGGLTSLTRLYLSHNRLTGLQPGIGQLTNLTRLDLSNNLLVSLPPELGRLAKLTVLDLSHNHLAGLPPETGLLAKLTVLTLSSNRLQSLPESLQALELLERLFLHDNPALQLAPSVLGGDPRLPQPARLASAKSILDFYFARLSGKARPLNEARLILLGSSGAGKTSIVQALRDQPWRDSEASTTGIAMGDMTLEGGANPPVTVHAWDFSGQEITHVLHPFFLSPRCVYVLVLGGRGGHDPEDARYWLEMIETFATDGHGHRPPVIVALNQWNVPGCRPEVDRASLRVRYPFIRSFVEMDCKTKKGVPILKTALTQALDRMPWVREPFPQEWDAVRQALAPGGTYPPFLTPDEFRAVCQKHGVTAQGQQDYLSEILHHLGTALNYQNDPRLHEASVLQPGWLTRHHYALLHRAQQQAGILRAADVASVLHAEPDASLQAHLLRLLERFGILRTLTSASGSFGLVPRALPATPPAGLESIRHDAAATRLRTTYQTWPDGLLVRIMARRFDFIEEMRDRKQLWINGVVLARKGARALIETHPATRQILITITGPEKPHQQLVNLCQEELRELHAEIPGLEAIGEILLNDEWVAWQKAPDDKSRATDIPS